MENKLTWRETWNIFKKTIYMEMEHISEET